MTAIASAKIDPKKYARLLAKTLPRAIGSEEENERLLAIVDKLMSKGDEARSPEENALLELLVTLIEKFEAEHYQLERTSSSTPLSILKELMAARGVKPRDLWSLLGSKGLASEILNGKRAISKRNAKALAIFFHVPAELFI